jgi:hypothetical protein
MLPRLQIVKPNTLSWNLKLVHKTLHEQPNKTPNVARISFLIGKHPQSLAPEVPKSAHATKHALADRKFSEWPSKYV